MSKIDNFNPNSRVTWEGCSVLLDINDGDRLVFARLSPASTLKIGKKNCSLKPLIGCPFGSLFKVENGKDGLFLLRIFHTEESNNIEEEEDGISEDVSKDNREIVDNNTAQRLTDQDIHAMQRWTRRQFCFHGMAFQWQDNFRQGATGDEIVEALITHSATFEKKTSFSQEKYRLRKQKKYAPKVLLRRPFARSICEAYFKKYPSRIGFLRLDALSLLLTMANVTAYSDILVVDMVGGLLTGAVAERLGGTGYVCNAYSGATPYPMDIARIFNFSNEICERLVRCCLTDLCPDLNRTCELVNQSKDACNSKTEQKEKLSSCESVSMEEDIVAEDDGVPEVIAEKAAPRALKPSKSAKAGEGASENLINLWKERGFSSLLIAAPELNAWSILQKLLPLLSYSAPFAIYHQYLQPLATCMHHLQIEKLAVGLQISEPWLREYQVLPSRTHPCMQMSAFGGYILSGTRTCTYDAHSH